MITVSEYDIFIERGSFYNNVYGRYCLTTCRLEKLYWHPWPMKNGRIYETCVVLKETMQMFAKNVFNISNYMTYIRYCSSNLITDPHTQIWINLTRLGVSQSYSFTQIHIRTNLRNIISTKTFLDYSTSFRQVSVCTASYCECILLSICRFFSISYGWVTLSPTCASR